MSASAARCPTCDAEVVVAPTAVASELVACRECGTDLEIVSVDPPSVTEAPMEEEDWGQ